ncbi:hypothetical protein WR25_05517 isoform B [Diploscapter pachys]|uniref:Uncharacterized protein n=1 Tax=Diploscapter pachys TaxID=2018661 RepID=A0A2A2KW48_9BILA|nr:hypothetical protein WR25_05517 isoform B [Diploscapter pachys]
MLTQNSNNYDNKFQMAKSSHPWAPTRSICVLLFVTLIGYSNGWFWDQPSPTIEPKLAETIVNSPEDIDASVILEEKKKYDEVRRKRQEDHELLRNLKTLPLGQRSMTKEQIKQLIYVRRPNETHEAQRQRAGMILFNWKHGTNLTYNPWLKFNSFVRPVNLERREQVIRAMVEKWVRQKRAPGDCVDTCAPPIESPTPLDSDNYPGYMTYSIDTTSGCSKMTISCTGLGGAFIGSSTVNQPDNNVSARK